MIDPEGGTQKFTYTRGAGAGYILESLTPGADATIGRFKPSLWVVVLNRSMASQLHRYTTKYGVRPGTREVKSEAVLEKHQRMQIRTARPGLIATIRQAELDEIYGAADRDPAIYIISFTEV